LHSARTLPSFSPSAERHGIKINAAAQTESVVTKMFLKNYYSLNKSNSKHVLTTLATQNEKYAGVVCIFGAKEGVSLSIKQFMQIYYKRSELYEFFETKKNQVFMDLTDEDRELTVKSRVGTCAMLLFSEKDKSTREISSLYLGKVTFEKLMQLEQLIYHNLYIIDKNVPEIIEFCKRMKKKQAEGDFHISDFNVIKDGLDYGLLALEILNYENGVQDAFC
jgi:hypothetical protein